MPLVVYDDRVRPTTMSVVGVADTGAGRMVSCWVAVAKPGADTDRVGVPGLVSAYSKVTLLAPGGTIICPLLMGWPFALKKLPPLEEELSVSVVAVLAVPNDLTSALLRARLKMVMFWMSPLKEAPEPRLVPSPAPKA